MASDTLAVLLIEDDAVDAEIVRRFLEKSSRFPFEMKHCRGRAAALESIEARRYDIVLLDYLVGGESGLDILRALRRSLFAGPVLVLTGQSDATIGRALLDAGASGYLEKGELSPEVLESIICAALEKTGSPVLQPDGHSA